MADTPSNRMELIEVMRMCYFAKGSWTGGVVNKRGAELILGAIEAANCVVVPKEATNEMWSDQSNRGTAKIIWEAMTAASPFRPTQEGK